jgi:hypothetical protein
MTLVAELSTWLGLSLLCSALLSRRWLIVTAMASVSAALACWAFVRVTRGSMGHLDQLDWVAIVAAGGGALLAAKGMGRLQQSARR